MPDAQEILRILQGIVDQGRSAAPLIRLVILAVAALFVLRRRVFSAVLAGVLALLLVAAGTFSLVFEDHQSLAVFAVLFPLGLIWGREALNLPSDTKPSAARVTAASVVGLVALFYPHFAEGPLGVLLLGPLGVLPCPTLIFACAAVILSGRTFTLVSVITTWVVSLSFGAAGVFYLGLKVDWALLVAVPVSIAAYFSAKRPTRRRASRLRRRR
ncbi:MAG: hypothetical protein ACYTAN_09965 [Planctomycetota bacterium]|jgi:hypothetical protein